MDIINKVTSFYKKNPVARGIILSLVVLMGLMFCWYITIPLIIFILFWWKFKKDKEVKINTKKVCPHCKTEVDSGASRCPHCHGKIFLWTLANIAIAVILGIIILSVIFTNNNQTPTASQPQVSINPPVVLPVSKSNTEEQRIGDIASGALQGISISKISYRDVQIESDNYQRPTGSKMVTANFIITSFYNKDSLINDTGSISSKTLQGIFKEKSKIQDAFVWFYGDTTDAYGNRKQEVLLTYTIDRKTFSKINWDNFDQTNLCNFLEQESVHNVDTGCKTLANIK